MKQDINCWNLLSKHFKNKNHLKKVITELFGNELEAANISDGKYLLSCEEFAALFDCLNMDIPLRRQALSAIIAIRSKTGHQSGIPELRQLFCALYAGEKTAIPVIELQLFIGGWTEDGNLSAFIRENSNSISTWPLPPQAAVCKVNNAASVRELQLPCGSLIIIDRENPPAPGELSLSLKRSGSFQLGEFTAASDFLWSAPVLRLHLIPKEL